MLLNYFIIPVRNLRRNFRHTVINVAGLAFAVAFSILAFLVYRFANSFDGWHPDAARIVRIEPIKASSNERIGMCPNPLVDIAGSSIAGVELATSVDANGTVVKLGDRVFNEILEFTDEHFRQMFDFELLYGSDDISDRSKVLITETIAEKYFGKENPIGKELLFFADSDAKKVLTIGGVIKKMPLNSSIHFDFLTHRDNQQDDGKRRDYQNWALNADAVFLKLKNTSDLAAVQTALQQYVAPQNSAAPDWKLSAFELAPLTEIALYADEIRYNGLWRGVPDGAVMGNITLAIMLLFAAMLNFTNMTLALSSRRLREMGVRKVMGGTRFQLIRQLLAESFVVVALGALLGLGFAYPVVDWFNATWHFTDFQVSWRDPAILTFLLFTTLLATFLAGIYPAFYLSGLRPVRIFRGGALLGGGSLFSRIMMGLQVVISIFAVITAISFARNAEFNKSADIGFSYHNVLQAWTANETDFRIFDNFAKKVPGVTATCGSRHLPGFGYNMNDFDYQGSVKQAMSYEVGNDFLSTLNFRLVAGQWPMAAADTVASPEIVVNEKFVREISGGVNPIGEQIMVRGTPCRISGVVADFMTNTPFSPISPALIRQVPVQKYTRCILKTGSPEQAAQVMATLRNEWPKMFPYTPFNVGYQNEYLEQAFEVSNNIARTMGLFSLVTIILCVTGLFSIISLDVQRRLREVAIRRVLGASAGNIGWILNQKLIVIFSISIIVGCLAGAGFSGKLMDTIFKINPGVGFDAILIGALGVVVIISGTILLKLWQTLKINPADVLKGE